jgi:hypothetical protein
MRVRAWGGGTLVRGWLTREPFGRRAGGVAGGLDAMQGGGGLLTVRRAPGRVIKPEGSTAGSPRCSESAARRPRPAPAAAAYNDWFVIDGKGYWSCDLAGSTSCSPFGGVGLGPMRNISAEDQSAKPSIKASKGKAVITWTGIKAFDTATGEAVKGKDLVVTVAGVYSLQPRPDLALSRSAGGGAEVARAPGGAADGGLTPAKVVFRVSKKGGAPADYDEVSALVCLGVKPTADWKKCADMNPLAPFDRNGTNLLP